MIIKLIFSKLKKIIQIYIKIHNIYKNVFEFNIKQMLLEKKLNYYEIFNENQIFLNFGKKAMSPGAIFLTPLLMGQ